MNELRWAANQLPGLPDRSRSLDSDEAKRHPRQDELAEGSIVDRVHLAPQSGSRARRHSPPRCPSEERRRRRGRGRRRRVAHTTAGVDGGSAHGMASPTAMTTERATVRSGSPEQLSLARGRCRPASRSAFSLPAPRANRRMTNFRGCAPACVDVQTAAQRWMDGFMGSWIQGCMDSWMNGWGNTGGRLCAPL